MKNALLLLALLFTGLLATKQKVRLRAKSRLRQEIGAQLLEKYLGEESKKDIEEMGGIWDSTGMDGLTNRQPEDNLAMRLQQKAKSAAMLYLKQKGERQHYEAYGCT